MPDIESTAKVRIGFNRTDHRHPLS